MRRAAVVGVVLAVCLSGTLVLAPQTSGAEAPPGCADTLCAGSARADITPPVTTPMWGYSARAFYAEPERWGEQRTRQVDTDLYAKALFLRSEGVHTRLYARAMVLRNAAGKQLALVQTDLGGITSELHRAVANDISSLGIDRDFLTISATHTHGGPGTIQHGPAHSLLVGDNFDPRTFKRVKDGIVRAIQLATDRLAPARAALGRGHLPDASANRAFTPFKNNPCPDPLAVDEPYTCTDDAETSRDLYAIDPRVVVLRVDRTDGVPLGVWTSFSAHGTMFGSADMRFSGDNQGVAERLIERGIADRADDAGIELPADHQIVAAYANGTEGDQTPQGDGHNRFASAEDSGRRQARAVLAAYDALAGDLTDDLPLDARWDWLYMTGQDGTSPVAILGAEGGCPDPVSDGFIPGQGNKCPFLPLTGLGNQWFPLQMLRVGDMAMVVAPSEVTLQMGRRIRKRVLDSPANQGQVTDAIVVGVSNGFMAYTTTPEEYEAQEYEGTFTLWGPEQGPLVRERFGALADRLFAGEPNPEFVEPPDVSATQADNVTATQAASVATSRTDPEPGTVLGQPASVPRGEVVAFTWIGGSPSVELQPDEIFARIERRVDGEWQTVADDTGFETLLDHWKEGTVDQWALQWDVTLDVPVAIYRISVEGRFWQDGSVETYTVTSEPFDVFFSGDIGLADVTTSDGRIVVHATYPAPGDGPASTCSAAKEPGETCPNFRWRPAAPTTGTATAVVDGIGEVTGTYDEAAGAYVITVDAPAGTGFAIEPGGVVDAYGNTNASEGFEGAL